MQEFLEKSLLLDKKASIWAAFHERSFEVGERSEVGALEVTTK